MSILLSPWEKKFMLVMANATIIMLVVGTYIISTVINPAKPVEEQLQVFFFFYSFAAMFAWTTVIPLVGKARSGEQNIPRLIFITLAIKMGMILVFELVDFSFSAAFLDTRMFFPGYADFRFQSLYAGNFLRGEPTFFAVIPHQAPKLVYYPPGVALVYVFLLFINPAGNSLLYRWYLLFFEAGVFFMIWKIASIPKLNISPSYRVKGVVYAFFGANILSAIDVFGKYDIIVLFITLVSIYLVLKENYLLSGCFMVLAGFIKLYPMVWIAGILLFLLRKKQAKNACLFILGNGIVGSAILFLSIVQEGSRLFDLLLGFQFQLIEGAYAIYMMNFWFYLAYTGLPFMSAIPYACLGVALLYFFIRGTQQIDIAFFIKSTAIVLIFYTAVNSVYINFIFPFMCIGMLSSVKKMRVLALMEISCMVIENLFNTIIHSAGLGDTLILSLSTFPPAWYLAFRFANLSIFMLMLVMLVLPERFTLLFPIEEEASLVLEPPQKNA